MTESPLAHLPLVDGPWFRTRTVGPTLDRIDEPHVHGLLQANVWHLRGRDRDLIVDTGLGVASLRDHLPHLFERDPVVVLTHAHLDHMGGAHEFACCWAHPGDPFDVPPPGSLHLGPLSEELGIRADAFGASDLALIDALPRTDYALDEYRLQPAADIRWLREGLRIDLGDREFTVLHLPGHTESSIGLFDESDGTFFSGDVLYDDVLIDDCVGSDVSKYRTTMGRLAELDVSVVNAGHGDRFDGTRMREIARTYLDKTHGCC
jgi:glyoxylase-like metal-dependent hydrolase (beta-lactamase superfamily II)